MFHFTHLLRLDTVATADLFRCSFDHNGGLMVGYSYIGQKRACEKLEMTL